MQYSPSQFERWADRLLAPRLAFALLFIASFCLLSIRLIATHNFVAGDSALHFMNLRSLFVDHDLDFSDEYQYFYELRSPYTGNRKLAYIPDNDPVTGRRPNGKPIGAAVALLPFYALGRIVTHGLHAFSPRVPDDGYGWSDQFFAALGGMIYGILAVWMIYRLGLFFYSRRTALLGALTICLATPLFYYMTIEPLMGHTIAAFLTSVVIYLWWAYRAERSMRQWALLGTMSGLAALVRYQDGLFFLIPLLDGWRGRAQIPGRLLCLLCFLAVLSSQGAVNCYLYGAPLRTGYYGELVFHPSWAGWYHFLIGIPCGALTMSPILLFCTLGLLRLGRSCRPLSVGLALAVFLQCFLISGLYPSIAQGNAFGNRMLLDSSVAIGMGAMEWIESRPFLSALAICILLILVSGGLAALYCLRFLPLSG